MFFYHKVLITLIIGILSYLHVSFMFFKDQLSAFRIGPSFFIFSDVFLSFILGIYKDYRLQRIELTFCSDVLDDI